MARVTIEFRGGLAFAYLNGAPLRTGDFVHFARGHRPPSLPTRGGKLRFERALWQSIELSREDGSRFEVALGEAHLVRG